MMILVFSFCKKRRKCWLLAISFLSNNVYKKFISNGPWNSRICGQQTPSLNPSLIHHFETDCIENIVEKGEIAHFEQFHLFPQCFPKAFFLHVSK